MQRIFWIFLVFAACQTGPVEKPQQAFFPPQAAGTWDTLPCLGDTGHTYTVYFPSGYRPNQDITACVGLDAHGRGTALIAPLARAADKLGILLVGSHAIRNNMPNADAAVQRLLRDMALRFRIDYQKVFLYGFSGGARLAGAVAANRLPLKIPVVSETGNYDQAFRPAGYIAAAAAFPPTKLDKQAIYIQICGLKDFNYIEARGQNIRMEQQGHAAQLLLFGQGHQIPPAHTAGEALFSLYIKTMRNTPDSIPGAWVSLYTRHKHYLADSLARNGKHASAYYVLQDALNTLEGYTYSKAILRAYKRLDKHNAVAEDKALRSRLVVQEKEMRHEYLALLENKNKGWWLMQIEILKTRIAQASGQRKLMLQRIGNFLSMVFYVKTRQAFQEDYYYVNKYLSLYQKIDPKNPDVFYFRARDFLKKGQPQKAAGALRKAFSLGFYDMYRLQAHPGLWELYQQNIKHNGKPAS